MRAEIPLTLLEYVLSCFLRLLRSAGAHSYLAGVDQLGFAFDLWCEDSVGSRVTLHPTSRVDCVAKETVSFVE